MLALLMLKEMVRKALPEPMIRMFPICGDMSTVAGLWQTVLTAGRAHEDMEHALKDRGKASAPTLKATSTTNEAVSSKGGSSSRAPKGEKAKATNLLAPKKDESTRVSKPLQKYSTYAEACEGVSSEMIRERRAAERCTRCGKKNHDAKFCQGKVNTTVALAEAWRPTSDANATITRQKSVRIFSRP